MIPDETRPDREPGSTLSTTIERYIRTIIHLRLKAARERSLEDRIADAITRFAGRMRFVYVHIAWFTV